MGTVPHSVQQPNPANIFEAFNAYQRSFALKAAVELDLFTVVGLGKNTVEQIAAATQASERGIRILCDFLTIGGFLRKEGKQYGLTIDSATFLDRNSPAYFGAASQFLLDPRLIAPYMNLTEVVRNGRTSLPGDGTVSPDNPIWLTFARQMAPLVYPAATEMAEMFAGSEPKKVLDIAAGHGLFGIMVAEQNRKAQITAVDWPDVLEIATENARKHGVAERHTSVGGDAFTLDFGGPYDLVLVTNFFHHFDPPACEQLMRKIHACLTDGGVCVNLDFVPNDDRVSPPTPAGFAMMMLGTTAAGDVYPFREYDIMFKNAGFASSELRQLTRSPETIIVARRA